MKRLSIFASISVFALLVGCSSAPEPPEREEIKVSEGVVTTALPEIAGRIDLGNDVGGMAIDSAAGIAYVAYPLDRELTIVDLKTRESVGTIDLPSYPVEVAVDANTVYVTTVEGQDGDGGKLQFVDRGNNQVVGAVDVGRRPRGLVVDDKSAFVPLVDAGAVVIVDKATRQITAQPASDGAMLSGIALDPESNIAYAIDRGGNRVLIVENNVITETISVAQTPRSIGFDSQTKRLYVGGQDGSVTVIDSGTREILATIDVAGEPQGIAVDPDRKRAYYMTRAGVVAVIDTETNAVVGSFDVGDQPFGIVVDTTSGAIYATADGGIDIAQVPA